jgi:hypothetical protein
MEFHVMRQRNLSDDSEEHRHPIYDMDAGGSEEDDVSFYSDND